MKKLLVLLLVVVMCLSLVACGGNNSETATIKQETNDVFEKNDTSKYLGVWENTKSRLTITKGGIGKLEFLAAIDNPNASFMQLSWEIKDDVLVVKSTLEGYEFSSVYELNEDASSLKVIQSGWPDLEDGNMYDKKS